MNTRVSSLSQIPVTNDIAYRVLFNFENALRELIIEKLEATNGPHWYKQALPGGEILNAYREAIQYQKSRPWTQNIPQHPIYYLNFPDLATIIERNVNWNNAFKTIFLRKDTIVSTLRELEPIRNKIAHNRIATTTDVDIVQTAVTKLSSYLGESYIVDLVNRSTSCQELPAMFKELADEAETCTKNCLSYQPIDSLLYWENAHNMWWFDSDYIGHDLQPIITFFKLLSEYGLLDRSRGKGHKIEQWVNEKELRESYDKAKHTFDEILAEFK